MISLLLRNLLFAILLPGVATWLIPYFLLKFTDKPLLPNPWTFWNYLGLVIICFGFSILIACIIRFATEGKGTLAPIDPTKKLVVRGLYRYSRNPMYLGVISILIGESVFWQSLALAAFCLILWIGFSLFISFHEEPRLRRDFGEEYEEYCKKVRRWL